MLRGRPLRLSAILVAAVLLLGACYRYVPTTTGDLVPGSAYRGYLTPEGSQRVAPLVGQDVGRFDGRIVTVLDTAYLVAMSATLKRPDPRPMVWTGEQLVIPRAAVTRFELRQLDRPRTVRAAALYTVGMLAAGTLWLLIKGGGERGDDGIVPPVPP